MNKTEKLCFEVQQRYPPKFCEVHLRVRMKVSPWSEADMSKCGGVDGTLWYCPACNQEKSKHDDAH
jgi:hypothetical protein